MSKKKVPKYLTNKKRKSLLVRNIPIDEMDKGFVSRLKWFMCDEFRKQIVQNQEIFNELHRAINLRLDQTTEQKKLKENGTANFSKNIICRSELIEGVNITESNMELILHYYQLKVLKSPIDKIRNFQRINDGLNYFLKEFEIPKEIDVLRSKYNNYRMLRHQFAHFNYGSFVFEAKEEQFESFLRRLPDLSIGDDYHAYYDAKPGVVMTYKIEGIKFLKNFYPLVYDYFTRLLELMFPPSDFKAYPYPNADKFKI